MSLAKKANKIIEDHSDCLVRLIWSDWMQ